MQARQKMVMISSTFDGTVPKAKTAVSLSERGLTLLIEGLTVLARAVVTFHHIVAKRTTYTSASTIIVVCNAYLSGCNEIAWFLERTKCCTMCEAAVPPRELQNHFFVVIH